MDGPPAEDALRDTTVAIGKEEGILGVALVRRDGSLVASVHGMPVSPDTVAAMSAVVAGAADLLLGRVGRGLARSVHVDGQQFQILIRPTDDHLLVVIAAHSVPVDRLHALLEAGEVRP